MEQRPLRHRARLPVPPFPDRRLRPAEERDFEDALDFEYTPLALPGARLPHVWLSDGRPIQDVLGREYTLVVVGDAEPVGAEALAEAFAGIGAPFAVVRPDSPYAAGVYGAGLILVRPDLHIVWRGAALPADVAGPREARHRARERDPATA